MKQEWHDLLFAHWAVPVQELGPLIPRALEIDTFGGRACVGVVPFRMSGVRVRGTPAVPGICLEIGAAFPNGAVTGVLVLAQSHLSIHTWPELALANVDLLSYGDVSGNAVLGEIRERLAVERASVTCVPRAVV